MKRLRMLVGLGMVMLVASTALAVGSAARADTPEIDPGSVAGAIALLASAALWITARRKQPAV